MIKIGPHLWSNLFLLPTLTGDRDETRNHRKQPQHQQHPGPISGANSPARAFYTNHHAGPVSAADSPAQAHTCPRRGNTGNAAKYGPLDRAAESWTDRELTECLRRNLDWAPQIVPRPG